MEQKKKPNSILIYNPTDCRVEVFVKMISSIWKALKGVSDDKIHFVSMTEPVDDLLNKYFLSESKKFPVEVAKLRKHLYEQIGEETFQRYLDSHAEYSLSGHSDHLYIFYDVSFNLKEKDFFKKIIKIEPDDFELIKQFKVWFDHSNLDEQEIHEFIIKSKGVADEKIIKITDDAFRLSALNIIHSLLAE